MEISLLDLPYKGLVFLFPWVQKVRQEEVVSLARYVAVGQHDAPAQLRSFLDVLEFFRKSFSTPGLICRFCRSPWLLLSVGLINCTSCWTSWLSNISLLNAHFVSYLSWNHPCLSFMFSFRHLRSLFNCAAGFEASKSSSYVFARLFHLFSPCSKNFLLKKLISMRITRAHLFFDYCINKILLLEKIQKRQTKNKCF